MTADFLLRFRRAFCPFFIGLLTPFWLRAQIPSGVFLNDTIEIGQPVQYALSIRHSAQNDVLFPDTGRYFSPFIVRKVAIFPTQTDEKGSLDSAVYTLVSFETTPVQILKTPVFVLNASADCTAVYSRPDTIRLKERIKSQQLDTLRLTTNTEVVTLRQQMNYPLLFTILFGFSLLGGLIFLLFGRTIRTRVGRYRLYRQHVDFERTFNRLIRHLGPETAHENAERAVVLWKEHLGWLERKPFLSLTTREIVDSVPDNRLADALKEIDGMVYGGVYSEQTQQSLKILREVADNSYRRRIIAMTGN